MREYIERLENETIRNYGFENKHTIRIFRYTEVLRKWFGIN